MKVNFQDIFCKGEHIKKDAKQSVDSFIKDCKNAKDNQHTDLISALTETDSYIQGDEETQATLTGQIHERRKDKKHLVIFYLASPKIY